MKNVMFRFTEDKGIYNIGIDNEFVWMFDYDKCIDYRITLDEVIKFIIKSGNQIIDNNEVG